MVPGPADAANEGSGIREQEAGTAGPDDGWSERGCRIVYVSPLKALAVDVERNLRSPLAGMANMARRMGVRVSRAD